MADPAAIDSPYLAEDLGALHNAIGLDSLDDIYEMPDRISSFKKSRRCNAIS
jgi:hypothetical protein